MALAIDPANQLRVTELEIYMLRRLHLMDDLNAELVELFREHHALTGDPATAEAMENAAKIECSISEMSMTHDPSRHSSVVANRLATAEQIMNGNNPFEKVDTPLGTMERWRAEAMLIGTTGGMLSVYRTIRADAASQAARADAEQAREALITHVCDQITELSRRFDNLEARLNEAEDARKADEARKAKLDEEPITLPPDLQRSQEPVKIGDDTHQPSGELHSLSSKEEPEDPDFEFEDDTSRQGSDDTDNEGGLPPELTKDTPPAPSTYPNFELPKPPVVSQPVAISLNEE